MKLVVQIPALNEAMTIKEVIESIPRDISGIDEVDVVVVDDGSTDATADLAREAGAQVVPHEKPRGVGAAFRSGIDKSGALGADIICTIDADMQFNPADIPKLVEPIARGEADFVTASRFKDPKLIPSMPKAKKWGNYFMARWISAFTKKRFYDVSCGFRAYSRNAYLRLVLTGDFTYTHETFLCLAYAQVPMLEVPIKVRGEREHGESRVANNLFKYGFRTASIILKTYRDYRPLRFFGWFAAASIVLGFSFFTLLLTWYIHAGKFFPHKWAGFVGAFFTVIGLMLLIVGVVAEMLDRMRVANDEVLFRVRRMEHELQRDRDRER
ncbi:MAG: glycosyltransferase family 2 protein [Verrucomicrobiota bacterium]